MASSSSQAAAAGGATDEGATAADRAEEAAEAPHGLEMAVGSTSHPGEWSWLLT